MINYKDEFLFLWAAGGGAQVSLAGLGTSDDFSTHEPNFTFGLFIASYMGDWDVRSNFLRSALAAGKCLAVTWSGRPHMYLDGMAQGKTIGECILASQNNRGELGPPGYSARGVHTALLGDPTLRLPEFMTPAPAPVPAPFIVLQSAFAITGPWNDAPGQILNEPYKTITVPKFGTTGFYKLRTNQPIHITGIGDLRDKIVIHYG